MNKLSQFFVEQPFDFNEFRRTVVQMQRAQRFNVHLSKVPMIGRLAAAQTTWISEVESERFLGMIDAMTPEERRQPHLIDIPQSRRRVAIDAGVEQADVLRLVAQFDAMASMVWEFSRMRFVDRVRWMIGQVRRELSVLFRKTAR